MMLTPPISSHLHQARPNHDAFFTSKALITSAHVGGYDANRTNIISPSLEFSLSSLGVASDEQYESIPGDKIALLARKFWAMHKFQKDRRRSSQNSRCCFECGDTTHFITNCSKRKKFDYSNKNDNSNKNFYSSKNNYKKKNRFGDKKKKNIKKIMSRACAALSNFDFSSEDLSSSEEDEKVNCKKKEGDFTGLCLMTKGGSSWHNSYFDSDSDVSGDLTYDGLSSKVHILEDALCSQDKLLCRVFCENKDLNLKLENSFVEISSLQSMHNDMSAKPCENCNMIIMKYVDLWIVHTQVTSQLKGAKLELKELKACSSLLGACTSCPMLKSDLEASSIEIKEPKQRLDHSSRYKVFHLLVKLVGLLRVNFCLLPKRTSS
jgi:hypothetical protein